MVVGDKLTVNFKLVRITDNCSISGVTCSQWSGPCLKQKKKKENHLRFDSRLWICQPIITILSDLDISAIRRATSFSGYKANH